MDVKGFNQFQNEILVIDTNLSGAIDAKCEFIAVQVAGLGRGERIGYDHPRFVELREQYRKFLESRND